MTLKISLAITINPGGLFSEKIKVLNTRPKSRIRNAKSVCSSEKEFSQRIQEADLEGLVDDREPLVILNILPPSVSMAHNARE